MATRIQLRRDTAANWTSADPVLAAGEPGVETDTDRVKVGDGVTAWSSLAYQDGLAPVQSVAGRTGAVTITSADLADFNTAAVAAGTGTFVTVVGDPASPIADAATARPAGAVIVYWVCANGVTPTNAIPADIIWNAAGQSTVTLSSGAALSDYTVNVTLDSGQSAIFAGALSDGSDVRVTDTNGNPVPYWIESWDSVAQTASLWVRVPEVANGTTTLTLTYGNSPPSFTVPPLGVFTRPGSAVGTGLAENMIYDGTTYAVVTSNGTSGPIDIWIATSPSGPWTQHASVLTTSAGQWDADAVYAPCLVYDSGTYYLFYSGGVGANTKPGKIGYATATSVTGPYTKQGVVLDVGAAGAFDSQRAVEPFVYYSGILGEWVMLYMGDSGATTTVIEQVGMATAPAITGPWTKTGTNPILSFGATGAFDSGTVADPFCVERDGVAYIGYAGAPGVNGSSRSWSMGMARTTDYQTFTKTGQVYGFGVSGGFDESSAFRGALFLDGGTWYYPYAGRNPSNVYEWGIATLDAASTASGSPPEVVFPFYDEFPGSTLDTEKWITSGTGTYSATVASGDLTLSSTGSTARSQATGRRLVGPGYLIEVSANHPKGGTTSLYAESGLADAAIANAVRLLDGGANWQKSASASNTSTTSNMAEAADTADHTFTTAFVSASEAAYQIDSNAAETITTNVPQGPLNPFLFVYDGTGAGVSQVVHWVRARRYAATPPTVSVA